MNLSQKTLEKLRKLINEETEYRSGPDLVEFFNQFGFEDRYGQGFPSRWYFTDEKLNAINGQPEIDKCIKMLFAPVNFVGRFNDLYKLISEFNEYLAFDGWEIFIDKKDISIRRAHEIDLNVSAQPPEEDYFLQTEFIELPINKLPIDQIYIPVLEQRIDEMKKTYAAQAYLSVVVITGSALEGLLLMLALEFPKEFNQCDCAPKLKDGSVKPLTSWTLRELIEVAGNLKFIGKDVKKFSHALRDFRNYIHPMQQHQSQFQPDEHTAKICMQVLRAAICQMHKAWDKMSG